ncbi:MAG: LTA synthase family protein [Spirochaetes bacterium]|nr:LTA synthase family protein [Spirochaetota bacterium]
MRNSFLLIFLALYLILWHASLIVVVPDATLLGSGRGLMLLLLLYLAVALVVVSLLGLLRGAGRVVRRAMRWAVSILFSFVAVIRLLDWGVVYYSGQHVNREFWYHAFYVDGTSFFFTIPSVVLMLSSAAAVVVFVRLLLRETGDAVSSTLAAAMKRSVTVALVIAAVFSPLLLKGSAEPGGSDELFMGIPEGHVIPSFARYLQRPQSEVITRLDDTMVRKLRDFGIVPYGMGEKFPLMKRSIFVDPPRAGRERPTAAGRPNVIIVIAESLNQAFIQEEHHGIAGLTPNYRDFMKRSIYFSNTLFTISPTIRGTIANLGSSMYLIDKIQGAGGRRNIRPPIVSRFLFISDVLKKRGYSTVHVQGGSGLFVGLKDAFLNKQSYDKFYCWESVELQRFASGTKKKDWGIRDQDVFRFAASLLEKGEIREPFLLSISTLDMHPPYDPLYRHPDAGDNSLLNSLYSTDKAFGSFWEYYNRSRIRDNTILIVIADHPALIDINFREFYSKNRNLPLGYQYFVFHAMHVPRSPWNGREVKTLCTSLDMVPTLLDVMNIDTENPFLGVSIFADRLKYRAPLNVGYYRNYREILDRLSPQERRYINAMSWTEDDQLRFMNFLEQLALRRAIYPEEQ